MFVCLSACLLVYFVVSCLLAAVLTPLSAIFLVSSIVQIIVIFIPFQGKAQSTSPHSSVTSNTKSNKPQQQLQRKQNEKNIRKSNTKRVEIEDGFKSQSPLISNFDGASHEITKVDSTNSDFGPKASVALSDEGFGGKTAEVDNLAKLPDFVGLNNRKDVQELFETPTNKKFDYYVEHFSNDPYLAESEKEEWMKDSDARMKQYRRRLGGTKMTQNTSHKNVK